MAVQAESRKVPSSKDHHQEKDLKEQLMLDPKPRGEMNALVMEAMQTTHWRFWVAIVILVIIVAVCLVGMWGYMIKEGLGVAGTNRPAYWGVFMVTKNSNCLLRNICLGFIEGLFGGIPPAIYSGSRINDHIRTNPGWPKYSDAYGPGLAILLDGSLPE